MVFGLLSSEENLFSVLVTMPVKDVEREERAAIRLQASVKGYRSRKAFQEVKTYPASVEEDGKEEEHEASGTGRGSIPRSSSAASLKECVRKTVDLFRRKRVVREAAILGKGMAQSYSASDLLLPQGENGEGPKGGERAGSATRKKVVFLSSQGTLRRESLDIPSVQSMPLKKKHWLEAVDAKHRYGSNLSRYYEVWKDSDTQENFFFWLDRGGGSKVELSDCSRSVLDSQTIKYCDKRERERYEVVIKDGIMSYKRTGERVHTMDSRRREPDPVTLPGGSPETDADDIKQDDTWIFVCSPEGRVYVGRKRLNVSPRFQHSSFLAGGAALAAGQMDVDHGNVVEVRAFSGHYRPKRENLLAFLQMLHERGVDTTQVKFRQFKNK